MIFNNYLLSDSHCKWTVSVGDDKSKNTLENQRNESVAPKDYSIALADHRSSNVELSNCDLKLEKIIGI